MLAGLDQCKSLRCPCRPVLYAASSTPDVRLARTLAALCRGHRPFQYRTKLLDAQIY